MTFVIDYDNYKNHLPGNLDLLNSTENMLFSVNELLVFM